ncbi:hypothetical protein EDC50_0657 [Vulcaniibacterium tengchongense]|uniref:Uncharacterized protein n=1 Tax=Vulcaniibacterium tengchongense TaxID=1273429 RepID=A0A3N4VEP0_9GAMM|nr:hypothetical protein EDC50_0657 [Vulcaniibacterium tengchongense]
MSDALAIVPSPVRGGGLGRARTAPHRAGALSVVRAPSLAPSLSRRRERGYPMHVGLFRQRENGSATHVG